jgi:pimeloyl-ACP methyl ester carboxylesterase
MGNVRGNTYSRNHVSFDTCSSCADFWSFGFDDSGVYDYSAEIDHVLETTTGYLKLHFVGHSMGCTQYLVNY